MSFEPLPREVTRERYADRPIEKLPGDLLEACDKIRAQKKEIDELRGDLIASNKIKWRLWIQNAALMAVLGGAAGEGMKVAAQALIKYFTHG